jgi:hypothetical protein
MNSLLAQFPFCGCTYLPLVAVGAEKVAKNGITLVRAMDTSPVIALGGVQVPVLEKCTQLAVIIRHMMVVVAPAA